MVGFLAVGSQSLVSIRRHQPICGTSGYEPLLRNAQDFQVTHAQDGQTEMYRDRILYCCFADFTSRITSANSSTNLDEHRCTGRSLLLKTLPLS